MNKQTKINIWIGIVFILLLIGSIKEHYKYTNLHLENIKLENQVQLKSEKSEIELLQEELRISKNIIDKASGIIEANNKENEIQKKLYNENTWKKRCLKEKMFEVSVWWTWSIDCKNNLEKWSSQEVF